MSIKGKRAKRMGRVVKTENIDYWIDRFARAYRKSDGADLTPKECRELEILLIDAKERIPKQLQ